MKNERSLWKQGAKILTSRLQCVLTIWRMTIRLVVLVVFSGIASTFAQQMPSDIVVPVTSPFRFVAYGDTRFTDPANTKAANPQVRQEIVRKIAEAQPAFISIAGDISYNGSDAADWAQYNKETAVWREKKIEVFPALGNHDLHGAEDVALANFFQCYPELHNSRYYSVRAGNALMLVLDSSLDEIAGPQGEWLKSKVGKIPSEVKFVFVVLHHPPYTSAKDEGHLARAREQALAAYLEDQQKHLGARLVVFSGHVHNYEHKEHGGVVYLITGGGGARPHPLQRQPDDLFKTYDVNFHFVTIDVEKESLKAVMHRVEMKDGQAEWTEPESMILSTDAKTMVAGGAK